MIAFGFESPTVPRPAAFTTRYGRSELTPSVCLCWCALRCSLLFGTQHPHFSHFTMPASFLASLFFFFPFKALSIPSVMGMLLLASWVHTLGLYLVDVVELVHELAADCSDAGELLHF